jgi:hypothetical protein
VAEPTDALKAPAAAGTDDTAGEHVSEYTTQTGDSHGRSAAPRKPVVTGNALGTGRRKEDQFDVISRITGGGVTGQAGALRLGIARALILVDPESRPALKRAGFLTRDARVKERKKAGLKKARKAPQYSKR